MTPVSLVITSYNREQYLGETIESVLAQTYRNFELWIWDDGSSDGSVEIAQKYASIDSRIRVEVAPHQGLSRSLHDALMATQHPYLCWVDNDDKLAPSALAETVAFLHERPQVGLVYTNYKTMDADGAVQGLGWITGGRLIVIYCAEQRPNSYMSYQLGIHKQRLVLTVNILR